LPDDSIVSATVWVPLVTAAVGLAAGLGTSVFTQRRADAREDVRWRRERDDRQEQWQREDSLRWVQDRKQAYARLVVALYEWDTALASAARASEKAVKANEQTELDLTEIKRAERVAFEALAPVRFIAPKDTRSRARLTFERHRIVSQNLARNLPHVGAEATERWNEMLDSTSKLDEAMWKDLGLENKPEDAKPVGE
jgi:hypothetical protein